MSNADDMQNEEQKIVTSQPGGTAFMDKIAQITDAVQGEGAEAFKRFVKELQEKQEAMLASAAQMEQLIAIIKSSETLSSLSVKETGETFKGTAEQRKNILEHFSKQLNSYYLSAETFKMVSENIQAKGAEMANLLPYIEEIMKEPKYDGQSLEMILAKGLNVNLDPIEGSLWEELSKNAAAAMVARAKEIQAKKQQEENTTHVIAKVPTEIDYPLDKINASIFNLLQEADGTGQLNFRFSAEKHGTEKQADILYSIDFDALKNEIAITKQLTAFDKRVYIAVSALFNYGNEVVSASQIYRAMGNGEKSPSKAAVAKINESLTKMAGAKIYLDNTNETDLYPKYDKFVYDGYLLPMERVNAFINNQIVESAIHIFREPPLTTFARQRKQITTVNRSLLESPINKTNANLALEDYLIEEISHMKGKRGRSKRMLFSTIAEKTNRKTEKKSRLTDTIERFLDYYKKDGFIKGYTMDKDGVNIIL